MSYFHLSISDSNSSSTAAATALLDIPELTAEQIARKAMRIAADLCVYTNHEHMVEVLESIEQDKLDK